MISEIIQVFWLFLPAGFANMAPVLFKWVPFLDTPVDLGGKMGGKRILGDHKTFRGLIFGILVAVIVVYLQRLIGYGPLIDYSSVNILWLGFLLGFGAVFGDMVKSFFKRRTGIKPGRSWVPFDQLDWVVGAIVFVNLHVALSFKLDLIALILFGLLHPVVNYVGYLLRIKKSKW